MDNLLAKIASALSSATGRIRTGLSATPSRLIDLPEKPRQVYLDACEQIAQAFAEDGFLYCKSGPHFTKRDDHFNYRVSFQSSHLNAAGELVRLWLHASVRSERLKEWRSKQQRPYRRDDWVAGGMVHLLHGKQTLIQWNLASPHNRQVVISDVIAFVRKEVLAYFQLFSSPHAAKGARLELNTEMKYE